MASYDFVNRYHTYTVFDNLIIFLFMYSFNLAVLFHKNIHNQGDKNTVVAVIDALTSNLFSKR